MPVARDGEWIELFSRKRQPGRVAIVIVSLVELAACATSGAIDEVAIDRSTQKDGGMASAYDAHSAPSGGAFGTSGTGGSSGAPKDAASDPLGSGGAFGDAAPPSGSGGTTSGSGGSSFSGSGGVPTSSGGSGTGGGSSGGSTGSLTSRTLPSGRTFLVYVPGSLNPAVPVPVVFVHHGLNGSADAVRKLTRFDQIAEEQGFIAVFPEGQNATWNAGVGVCGLGQFVTGLSDDFTFVQNMIASLQTTNNIDRARVFTTGFSMGGYFANNVGCMRPDLIKAIGPHSGGGPPVGCVAGPMPAIIFHGTADSLIWYTCGVQARDTWVAHNGCATTVDVVPVKGGSCEWSRGCPPGGQVVLCHMDGMGHGWAGVDGTDGGGSQYEFASRVIWDFFAKL